MKNTFINKIAARFGLKLVSIHPELPPDLAQDMVFMRYYQRVKPYTMTSPERLYALYQAVRYTLDNNIPGHFVECGVWKGGSCMLMAMMLAEHGDNNRLIYLYDTFEGMSEPTEKDKQFSGESAEMLLQQADKEFQGSIWCYSSLEEVRTNVLSVGLPSERFVLTKGKVEDTIPGVIPGQVALLRLDTDWYESTRHELIHLYPLLSAKGILIIDDFGHWEGARKAVEEYFSEQGIVPYIHRIDYTGRLVLK
jgi:hypothetical protein